MVHLTVSDRWIVSDEASMLPKTINRHSKTILENTADSKIVSNVVHCMSSVRYIDSLWYDLGNHAVFIDLL